MSTATLDISEARKDFARLPDRLQEDKVIWVTKHNKKAFAVVDMELMEALLETLEILRDPEAFKMFQDSMEDIRKGQLVDHDDLEELLKKEESRGRDSQSGYSVDERGKQPSAGDAKKRGNRNPSKN